MVTAQLDLLLQHIRKLAAGRCSSERTDRELLGDFSELRDEIAFATLIARHGPMVLQVCRRVLNHEQDAEDAFQATFLVLVRNTASIRKPVALAQWLHGVAYRIAMKAKQSAARRRNHETRRTALIPKVAPSPTWDDVQAVLDEEIERLPETFRTAFVLCVLEGKSRLEAAAELGIKEGTLSSRLSRARQRLQKQLSRRGIELSALLAALSVAENASQAMVPAALASATVRWGLLVAAGETAAGFLPTHVAALAAGVTQAMLLTKAKIATAILLTVTLLASTAGILTYQALSADAPQDKSKPSTAVLTEPMQLPAVTNVVKDTAGQPAAAECSFEWKFQKGKTLYLETTNESTHLMKEMPGDVAQNHKQTWIVSWTPLEKQGIDWQVKQKIEAVKFAMERGGRKTAYDSTKKNDKPDRMTTRFKDSVGTEAILTITPQMRITHIESTRPLGEALRIEGRGAQEKGFEQMIAPAFLTFPTAAVKKGDTWTKKENLDTGPMGSYDTKYKYTYQGRDGKLDKITVEADLNYLPPRADSTTGLPFRIKQGELKTTKSTGTILFHNEKHRLDRSDMSLELVMTLTIETGGETNRVELVQTHRTTVRITDSNPLKQ